MSEAYYLTAEHKDKLSRIAHELGRDVSDLVYSAIDESILDYERSCGEVKI